MSFTKAQTGVAISAASGTTLVPVLATNPVAGHLVVLSLLWFDGTAGTAPTYTIADGNGNNFTQESHNSGQTLIATAGYIAQAYLIAPTNANKTITVTFSKAGTSMAAWVNDFAPSVGTPTYDNGAFASGTANPIVLPSIPVAGSNELVSNMTAQSNTLTAPTGAWVLHDAGLIFGVGSAHILSVSAATAVGWTCVGNNDENSIGMSFSDVVSAELRRIVITRSS